jgi:hypothetical protein
MPGGGGRRYRFGDCEADWTWGDCQPCVVHQFDTRRESVYDTFDSGKGGTLGSRYEGA